MKRHSSLTPWGRGEGLAFQGANGFGDANRSTALERLAASTPVSDHGRRLQRLIPRSLPGGGEATQHWPNLGDITRKIVARNQLDFGDGHVANRLCCQSFGPLVEQ